MPAAVSADHWSLDKRIPVATLVMLVGQTAAVVWWAASITGSVSRLEAEVAQLQDQANRNNANNRLAVLETEIKALSNTVQRLETSVVKVSDKVLEFAFEMRRNGHNVQLPTTAPAPTRR